MRPHLCRALTLLALVCCDVLSIWGSAEQISGPVRGCSVGTFLFHTRERAPVSDGSLKRFLPLSVFLPAVNDMPLRLRFLALSFRALTAGSPFPLLFL